MSIQRLEITVLYTAGHYVSLLTRWDAAEHPVSNGSLTRPKQVGRWRWRLAGQPLTSDLRELLGALSREMAP